MLKHSDKVNLTFVGTNSYPNTDIILYSTYIVPKRDKHHIASMIETRRDRGLENQAPNK